MLTESGVQKPSEMFTPPEPPKKGTAMSDDTFNMSLRKFLKTVGVTSQQEIEAAVRRAQDAGTLPAGPLNAKMVLTLDGVDLRHEVTGTVDVGSQAK